MNPTTAWIKRPAAYAVPAFVLFGLFQACGGSDDAGAATDPADPLEGVWESVVTAKDCTSGAPLGGFTGSQVYHRGGTVSDTNGTPPTTRGPGFGTWSRSGDIYTVRFRFFIYDAAGASTGSRRVTRTVALSADRNSAATTTISTNDIYDVAGVKIGSGCASDVSVRIF